MTGLEIAMLATSAASTGFATAQAYAANQANAAISEQNARQVAADSRVEEGRVRRSNEKRLAEARIRGAGSGFSMDGSISDVLADMAAEAELEALAPRTEGERQARYLRLQGEQYKKAATGALIGGALKIGNTIATQAYDAWGKG